MPVDTIQSQQVYSDHTFKQVDCKNQTITDSEFSACRFVRCDFSEAALHHCRFIDCTFDRCLLRVTDVSDSTFARVMFSQSDAPGVNWSDADWSGWATKTGSLSFQGCNVRYSIFFGLTLRDFTLTDCNAQETNFAESSLIAANLTGTDFTGAIFLRTDLTDASFVRASGYTLNLNDNDNTTDGTKFSLPEAVRLSFSA